MKYSPKLKLRNRRSTFPAAAIALTERPFCLALQRFQIEVYLHAEGFIGNTYLDSSVSVTHGQKSAEDFTQGLAHWRNGAPSQPSD